MAAGSSYRSPLGLSFIDGVVAFSGGDTSAPFRNHVKLGLNGQVVNLSANGLSLKFSLRSGWGEWARSIGLATRG